MTETGTKNEFGTPAFNDEKKPRIEENLQVFFSGIFEMSYQLSLIFAISF